MYHKVEQTYYALSATALFGMMFVISPTSSADVEKFQQGIVEQFQVAFEQVVGDVDLVEPLDLVWSGMESFYDQGSTQVLAMIPVVEVPEEVPVALANAKTATISFFAKGLENVLPQPRAESPTVALGEPVYNIVPPFNVPDLAAYNVIRVEELAIVKTEIDPGQSETTTFVSVSDSPPAVAGVSIAAEEPVNSSQPWVTLKDNLTGQLYCVAIYNNEVNKYLGECQRDYL